MADKLFNDFPERLTPSGNDFALVELTPGDYRRVRLSNFPGGGGGGDVTAPTVVSATVNNANPNQVVVVFSESVTVTTAGWSFRRNGSNWAITSVSGSGTTWTFTMATSAAYGETLDRSYDSTTGATVDGSANELASFTNSSVTNNVSGTIHNSTFTASNGTAITAYTPETGNTWVNDQGTGEIQTGRAVAATLSSNEWQSFVLLSQNTYTLTTVIRSVSTRDAYIFFRRSTAALSNCMFIIVSWSANSIRLFKYDGAATQVGSTYTPSPALDTSTDYTFALTVGATTCSLTINGTPVFTSESIDSGATGNYIGIGQTGAGGAAGDIAFGSVNVVP